MPSSPLRRYSLWALSLLVSVLLALPPVPGQAAPGAAATIDTIAVKGLTAIPEGELLDLLDIGAGRPLDRKRLQAGIKRAFLKGLFEDIVVEESPAAPSKITVTVRERKVIGAITVRGNDHFPKRFVRRYLDLKKGERLARLKADRGLEQLIHEMRQRGFPAASARLTTVPERRNRVAVVIDIEEGRPERIEKIVIDGPADTVRSFLPFSEGDVFDRTKMDRAAQKITSSYRKQGYVGTVLSSAYEQGILMLRLQKGERITVSFEGNAALSAKTLAKAVPFFELNEVSEDLVEETAARIVALYHQQGYPFAQITPVKSLSGGDTVQYTFYIFEGERFRVAAIQFSGVSISPERLRAAMALKEGDYYNPELLESDIELLEDFYHALGYLYVTIAEPELRIPDTTVSLTFTVDEGPQVTVAELAVRNNRVLSNEAVLGEVAVKVGAPYNEVDLAEARRKILDLYNRKGFLDTQVVIEREISATAASVTFVIDEGEATRFGKTVIIGNERTKPHVLQRELLHKEGELFDYSVLMKERQELYRIGLFSDVEISPADKDDGARDIIYRVREANAGAVEFGVGYGEYEKYRAFLDISYRNLFGTNRQVSFRTELSTLEQRYLLSYYEPWFFDRDVAFRSLLLHERREEKNIDTGETRFRLVRNTAAAGLEKKLSRTLKAELFYDYSVVETSDVQPGIILSREDTGTLTISGLRPGLIYDTRDNPFEPRRGVLAGLSAKFATGLLLSETDFLKVQAYASTYKGLSRRVVLAASLRGGVAKGFGDTRELPLVERFFLGGRTTVRGYEQDLLGPKGADNNPTGGNAFAMGSIEVRTDVGRGIGIVTFLDGGNVWTKTEEFDLTTLKYTTGLGLRYNTPVGPFRIDYGFKLNKETGESDGEIHFSLGHAF